MNSAGVLFILFAFCTLILIHAAIKIEQTESKNNRSPHGTHGPSDSREYQDPFQER